MYNREVLEKLEYLITKYEARIYRGEDVERSYISLCGFNEVHKAITGEGIFNERLLQVLKPNLYNDALRYKNILNENMIINLLSLEKFTIEEFPEKLK